VHVFPASRVSIANWKSGPRAHIVDDTNAIVESLCGGADLNGGIPGTVNGISLQRRAAKRSAVMIPSAGTSLMEFPMTRDPGRLTPREASPPNECTAPFVPDLHKSLRAKMPNAPPASKLSVFTNRLR